MPVSAERMSPQQRRLRAAGAALARHRGPDDPERASTQEALAAATAEARLDRHIDELVAAAPRMTPEQADRLRRLFTYAPAEGGATG